jgi:hypothetical protein
MWASDTPSCLTSARVSWGCEGDLHLGFFCCGLMRCGARSAHPCLPSLLVGISKRLTPLHAQYLPQWVRPWGLTCLMAVQVLLCIACGDFHSLPLSVTLLLTKVILALCGKGLCMVVRTLVYRSASQNINQLCVGPHVVLVPPAPAFCSLCCYHWALVQSTARCQQRLTCCCCYCCCVVCGCLCSQRGCALGSGR